MSDKEKRIIIMTKIIKKIIVDDPNGISIVSVREIYILGWLKDIIQAWYNSELHRCMKEYEGY